MDDQDIRLQEPEAKEERQKAMIDGLRAVLAAADELIACPDLESLLRRAVELAREHLGLERCGLFIEDESGEYMVGTYGTDMAGNTTDEHETRFLREEWQHFLKRAEPGEPRWFLYENRPLVEWDGKEYVEVGLSWKAVTPLQSFAGVVGVLFNDTAISRAPVDEIRQELVAVYCSLLGNILQRKRTEEALKISEARYRAIVEDQTELICRSLPEGTLTFVNDAYCRYFGKKREEIEGTCFVPHIPEEDDRRLQKHLASLNPQNPVAMIEHRVIMPDGEMRWQQWTDRAIFDHNGHVIEYQSVGRDITEKRRMEEELLRIEKLESVGVLAGGIAHDFNNILAAILGNISLARLWAGSDDQIVERLTAAEQACLRAKGLTQQLLTFARGGEPVKSTGYIADLLKESALFVLSGTNVRCEFSIPDDLWPIDRDEGQMSQAIHNLVLNARQAMPGGGVIRIRADNIRAVGTDQDLPLQEGRYVRIAISDEGIGIPEEHLPRIFDPYFTTKPRGSGLGLATTYAIIKNHDGYIHVESRVGVGTTFCLYLPAASQEALPLSEPEEKLSTGRGRILIIDDEEIILEVAAEILRELGYTVECAGDGVRAIELYRKARESGQPFDVVLIDLTIPGSMGGLEALHHIRQIDPEVKAIVSSGYSDDPAMARFREHGFKGCVAKPYKIGDLGAEVRRVLQEE